MDVDAHPHSRSRYDEHPHGMNSSTPVKGNNNNVTPSSTASTPRTGLNSSMSSTSSSTKRRKSRKSMSSQSQHEGNYPSSGYSHHPGSQAPPHYNPQSHPYNPHHMQGPGPGQYPPPHGHHNMWSQHGPGPGYGNQSWSRQQGQQPSSHIFRQGQGSNRSSYPNDYGGGWYGSGAGGPSHYNEKSSETSSTSSKHLEKDSHSPGRPRSSSPTKRSKSGPPSGGKHRPPPPPPYNNPNHWGPHPPNPNHWQGGSNNGPPPPPHHMPQSHPHAPLHGPVPPHGPGGHPVLPQHLMSGNGGGPGGSQRPGRANAGTSMSSPVGKMWGGGGMEDRRRDPFAWNPEDIPLCVNVGMEDEESRRKKERQDEKGRGSYRCGRCGVPKKGHVCPYQPKLKRRPDEPPPEMKNAATQVEIDEYMILRRLNLEIQGFPESYASEPATNDTNLGAGLGGDTASSSNSPQHHNVHTQSPHHAPPAHHQPSPHHSQHSQPGSHHPQSESPYHPHHSRSPHHSSHLNHNRGSHPHHRPPSYSSHSPHSSVPPRHNLPPQPPPNYHHNPPPPPSHSRSSGYGHGHSPPRGPTVHGVNDGEGSTHGSVSHQDSGRSSHGHSRAHVSGPSSGRSGGGRGDNMGGMMNSSPPVAATISTSTGMGMDSGGSSSGSRPMM